MRQPGLGEIRGLGRGSLPNSILSGARRALATTDSGGWRQDLSFEPTDALKVTMRSERGVTPPGLLTVPFRFQCPPIDRFGRPQRWDYPTSDTLRNGQQLGKGSSVPNVVSFATMFVDVDEDQPWVTWRGSFDVQRLLDELTAIGDRFAAFRLTIGQPALWGARPLVNTIAVLTSLNPEQRGGAVGTEYTDVEFTQRERQRLTRVRARRPKDTDHERRHTLQKGDTLYSIARHYYQGQASLWKGLAKANGIKDIAPDEADALAKWCRAHHRTTLEIPASEDRIEVIG